MLSVYVSDMGLMVFENLRPGRVTKRGWVRIGSVDWMRARSTREQQPGETAPRWDGKGSEDS